MVAITGTDECLDSGLRRLPTGIRRGLVKARNRITVLQRFHALKVDRVDQPEDVLLFHVGKHDCQMADTGVLVQAEAAFSDVHVGPDPIVADRQRAVGRLIVVRGQAELLHVVAAGRAGGGLTDLLDCR